jgi:hypothetical protein
VTTHVEEVEETPEKIKQQMNSVNESVLRK